MILILLLLGLCLTPASASCSYLGIENRTCSQELGDGSFVSATYQVICNTTTNIYDVLDNSTTRCGDIPYGLCLNGFTVNPSFCQFSTSCDTPNGPLDSSALITTPTATKTVTCQGFTLNLEYTYDSTHKTCAYSLDTTQESPTNATLLMRIPTLPASQVWFYDPGQSGSQLLHESVPQGLTLSDLCLFLKSRATLTQFECVAPFLTKAGQYCVLDTELRFTCNEYDVVCDVQLDNTYTCTVAGPVEQLVSRCSGNAISLMALMLRQATVVRNLNLTDVGDLPSQYLDGLEFAACTEMALTCSDPLLRNSPSDFFNCSYPYVPPSPTNPLNSSFCELTATHTEVPVTCFGQQLICASQESRNSTHLCQYQGGFLHVDCPVNGSSLADVYNITDEISAFFANCSANTGTCDESQFARLFEILQRSTLGVASGDPFDLADFSGESGPELLMEPDWSKIIPSQSAALRAQIQGRRTQLEEGLPLTTQPPPLSLLPLHHLALKQHPSGLMVNPWTGRLMPQEAAPHAARTLLQLPAHATYPHPVRAKERQHEKWVQEMNRHIQVHMDAFVATHPQSMNDWIHNRAQFGGSRLLASGGSRIGSAAGGSRRLLGYFEDTYGNLSVRYDSIINNYCTYLLNTCDDTTQLVCIDQQFATGIERMYRGTYCTTPLPDTCQNFTGDMPQNVTRDPVCTTACLTEQYFIRCPKIASPLPNFDDPTNSSDALFHDIFCTLIPQTGNCYYQCFAHSDVLQFSAYPVPAAILLDPALTGTAAGERLKCATIYGVAIQPLTDTNFFVCSGGYVTTTTTVLVNNVNTTKVQDICVASSEPDTVQLNCGELLVTCRRQPLSILFTCQSDTWSCANNHTCAANFPYLYAPGVDPSVLFPPPQLTQAQRCVQIRDTYALAPGGNFSCPLSGPCVANVTANCTRTNTGLVFCTPTFTADDAPPTVLFNCGIENYSNISVTVTCAFNGDDSLDYSCTSSYTTDQLAALHAAGVSTATSLPLSMSCSAVDAFGLIIEFGPTNGNVSNLLTSSSPAPDLATNLQRCMLVKRSCDAPGDQFRCDCNFLQDTLANQFCDAPLSLAGNASLSIINTTVSCGSNPQHSIRCTNDANATLTRYGHWTLCSARNSGPFDLNCMISTDLFAASLLDQSTCELVRLQCQTPLLCDPGVDCECPTFLSPAAFSCGFPAAVCLNHLCQYPLPNDTAPSELDLFMSSQVCDYLPALLNLTCTDGPGTVLDIRTGHEVDRPSYGITCVRQTVGVAFAQLVQYQCGCANSSYGGAGGFCGPSDNRLQMNITIPARTIRYWTNETQACLAIGQAAVQGSAIQCLDPFLSTNTQPFCSTPLDDPSAVVARFTCDGLLISCTGDSDTGHQRCSSSNDSVVWTLLSNKDSALFPEPPGFTGCVIGPPQVPVDFYKNQGERCIDLLTNCRHTCLVDVSAPGQDSQVTNPNIEVAASMQNVSICRSYEQGLRDFFCDGQEIVCTPIAIEDQNVNISQPLLDADFARNGQFMQCNASNFTQHLDLDCQVSLFAFEHQPDACATLVSECSRNLGHITCVGDYYATQDHPFCTLQFASHEAQELCDCGLWWSQEEGLGLTPIGLRDVSCYGYDPQNALLGILPSSGDPATDPNAGAPGHPATLTAEMRATCNISQVDEVATLGPIGLRCDLRGYISYDVYLRRRYGAGYATQAHKVYKTQGHAYMQYWCLQSYNNPVAVCAVQPGMRLPLCVVECPEWLVETSINGSTARYCCRDPLHCTSADDVRNCVMGRGDPSCGAVVDAPWTCSGHSSNPSLTANFTGLETVIVQVDGQNVSLVPTRQCPPNLHSDMTSHPLPPVQTESWDQLMSLCSLDALCNGFVTAKNPSQGVKGAYFLRRQAQLTFYPAPENVAQLKVTEILVTSDPNRRQDLDSENSYAPWHPFPSSALLRRGTELFYGENDAQQTFDSFVLSRTYGQACTDQAFDSLWYGVNSPGAMGRSIDREFARFRQLGGDIQLQMDMNFADPARREPIRLDQRQQDFVLDNASQPVFVWKPFLVVNELQELDTDLGLFGLTLTGLTVETNATFDVINSAVTCTSGCGDAVTTFGSVWQQHTSFDNGRYLLPIFGNAQGDTDMTVDIIRANNLAILNVGMTGNAIDRTTVVGYVVLDDSIERVQMPTFWFLVLYWFWRDWLVYGAIHTRDWTIPSTSAMCNRANPMYAPGFFNADRTQLCSSEAALCPLPVPTTWRWKQEDGSSFPLLQSFPDPPQSAIPHDLNWRPCSGSHGICQSRPSALPGGGRCSCFASFQTAPPIVTGVSHIPSSLVIRACEVDIRGLCTNLDQGVSVVCNSNGRCLSTFKNNAQSAGCMCGSFPSNCDVAPGGRTCESRGLSWVENGFEIPNDVEVFCTVPRRGCRSPGAWNRPTSDEFVRNNSYSCIMPPVSHNVGNVYGQCVIDPVGLAANHGDLTADEAWICNCSASGHHRYGRLCEFISLSGKCFDPATERQYLPAGVRSSVETVIWNKYLTRLESLTQTSLTALEIAAAPQFVGGGQICSNHGSCQHPGYLTPENDRWENVATTPLELAIVTPAELAFDAAVLARLLQQHCVCDPGWTGPFCSVATCAGGCGNGTCVDGVCSCPRDATGRLLVEGSNCNGTVCSGRGELSRTVSGDWTCSCDLPYYQNANNQCNNFCNCTKACGSNPPVSLIPTLTGSWQTPACACQPSGRLVLCAPQFQRT